MIVIGLVIVISAFLLFVAGVYRARVLDTGREMEATLNPTAHGLELAGLTLTTMLVLATVAAWLARSLPPPM